MLEDVLEAVAPTADQSRLVLVTVDPTAIALAERYGARTVDDGADDGHTGSVTAAALRLAGEGASGFLTLPGDVPLTTSEEVRRILDVHLAAPAPAFTIAPSHDAFGSNAVAMSPPDAVALRFGDDSYRPHLAAARAAGIEPAIVNLPGIAEDIDTPDDLDRVSAIASLRVTRTYLLLQEFASARLTSAESTS